MLTTDLKGYSNTVANMHMEINMINAFKMPAVCFTKIALILLFFFTAGCSKSPEETPNQYLIRVGSSVITPLEFQEAFEITKTAYPHNVILNPEAYKAAQIRLLNQLTEELVLLERAKELNLVVDETQVQNAIDYIKEDYPAGVFEETLLENAITYHTWEKGIRTRLIMEKVIEKELEEKIVITAEEVKDFYENHYKSNEINIKEDSSSENNIENSTENDSDNINEIIIKHLRKQKAEQSYQKWITDLQKRYTIDINQELWGKIINT